jgi:hypothetical protein
MKLAAVPHSSDSPVISQVVLNSIYRGAELGQCASACPAPPVTDHGHSLQLRFHPAKLLKKRGQRPVTDCHKTLAEEDFDALCVSFSCEMDRMESLSRIAKSLTILAAYAGICASPSLGQQAAQSKGGGVKSAPAKGGTASTQAPQQVEGTLLQVMRGILFPASNVVFAAQSDDPAKFPQAKDPATATDLLASTYGGWIAVENASVAMAEAANLLVLPGRKCSSGIAVPVGNADWPKLVQGLRDAAMTSYKAAQSKNQDNILAAADVLTTACANCHDKYREKANLADRCK